MDEKLQDAYAALQAAHDSGNKADATQIADYIETLKAQQKAAEPVVEKESPEALGGMGAITGGVAATGDVLYSKGRPLFRIAEKAMGMDSAEPKVKPRTFLNPSDVAQQAIDRRTVAAPDVTGSPSAVRNWGVSQHEGEFLGGNEYKDADQIKKEAMAFEKANPTKKVLPGSLLAVPEEEAARMAKQRAELAAQEDIAKQAEVNALAEKRAERLGERAALKGKQNKFAMGKGAAELVGKAALPVLGGYQLGAQGAQAYNRLSRPDLTASDIAAGGTNIIGAGAGALSMVPKKYRVPAAIISQGASAVANWLDKRNPRNEEEKADGGLVHLAKGGAAAKKAAELVKGYLHHTAIKPNELVGTRYKTTDLGGLITPYEFDPSKYMGAKIIHRPYDLSSRNQLVEEVSGHKLEKPFKTSGGQPFGRDIELQKIGIGGASNEEFNDRILDRVNAAAKEGNGQVLNIPSSMSFGSEAFSTMPVSIQRDLLKQRELSPEAITQLNAEMRNFDPKKFQNFLGFEHPEVEKQLLEGGYGLGTTPGQLRKHLAQRLGTKANQKLLDYNVEDLYHAIRDPDLRNTPPGYMGLTVMESKPFAPAFGSGYHDAYNAGDASTYVGKGANAPISLWMPDSYREAFARMKSEQPGANLTNLRSQARNILGTQQSGVAQTMNQQVVDNLGRYKEAVEADKLDPNNLDEIHKYIYGKKAEEYADGGSVMPDVSMDVRSIPSMTGQPGVGYMQTPQGSMARVQLEKQFDDIIARAGASGMAMAVPGQHGVKTMPGQLDIGANMPVGPGRLDISANRSINPMPGRGHQQGVNARYTIPFAEGGLVEYLAKGGKVPEAVVKAYKLFKTKQNAPGELYPLFVNANKSVPIGEWVPAEVGPVAASGKVKSKLGELAYRPGWHAGDLPVATHIGGKSEPGLRAPDFRRPDEVWAEVEMPADVDWQTIANQRARLNKAGNPIPSTAHITDAIPEGGHYRYKTSPNMQGNWLIGGDMKVNKVLTDEEVQAINEAAGVADLPRFTKFEEKAAGGKVGALANLAKFLEGAKIPQRLYHGTTAAEKGGAEALSQLKQSKEGALGAGVYMTPKADFANEYANQVGGYVMPVHSNLKNPLVIHSTMGPEGNGDPMMLALTQLGVTPEKAEKIIEKAYDTRGYVGKEVMSRAQKQGYDGIAQYKDGDLSEVVSFSPYGIKSATGNSGEFAPWDPNLSKKRGGLV